MAPYHGEILDALPAHHRHEGCERTLCAPQRPGLPLIVIIQGGLAKAGLVVTHTPHITHLNRTYVTMRGMCNNNTMYYYTRMSLVRNQLTSCHSSLPASWRSGRATSSHYECVCVWNEGRHTENDFAAD